jgi:hypothetical protein
MKLSKTCCVKCKLFKHGCKYKDSDMYWCDNAIRKGKCNAADVCLPCPDFKEKEHGTDRN